MKTRLLLLIFLLPILTPEVHSQQRDSSYFFPFGFDLYGSFIPIPAGGFHVLTNLHAGFSFQKAENFGAVMSTWGYGNAYENNNYTGVGLQYRAPIRKAILKFEYGLLLNYKKINEDFTVSIRPGGRAAYFRLHAGLRLGKMLVMGFNLNFIPESKYIIFTSFRRPPAPPIDSFRRPLNRHRSFSLFFGFSIP
ncbi:MAG: hypothetical protein R8P61_35580 [Bacteroidia bacterium]|nr:hypothetical protein [Bacteroidia bacterium]